MAIGKIVLTTLLLALVPGLSAGQHTGHDHTKPYAGQQSRTIKSLSEDDIAELRRGGGWGLAKTAELNGMPGPAHLLELGEQIALEPRQLSAIKSLFERMRAAAMSEGSRLIELERMLDQEFQSRAITAESLRSLLSQIEASRARLRYIHLSAHLETPALLSEAQIARYNALRGYGSDPCAAVPSGHDAAMWRKHNRCN